MKKVAKFFLWFFGILVVLLVLAVVGLKLFFPEEKVRQLAVEQASAALGRDVSVESIDLSVWGGLGLKLVGVTVANPPGFESDTFLTAESIDLKLSLLPLLSSEYRVRRLIVEGPVVHLIKRPDGSSNYVFEAVDSAMPPQAAEQIPDEAKPAAAAVSFDELDITDGQITYRDDSSGVQIGLGRFDLSTELSNPDEGQYSTLGRLIIDDLAVTLEEAYPTIDLQLGYEAELDLNEKRINVPRADLQLNGFQFNMTASVEDFVDTPKARANIESDRMSVADLFLLLPEGQRGELVDFNIEGGVAVDVDVTYDAATEEALSYTGTATISDMAMSKTGIDGELTFRRALIDFKTDNLRMNIEEGKFDGQPFKGHLIVDDFDNPTLSGQLAGSVNLAFVEPFLPAEEEHQLDGRANFDLKMSGQASDVESISFSGNLEVEDGSYNSQLLPEAIDAFTLEAYFDNDLVHIRNLDTRFASGNLNFSGRVNNLVPYLMADSIEVQTVSLGIEGKLKGDVNLEMINPFLPEKGDPTATGKLSMDLRFAGDATELSNFQPWGTISVSEASYTDSLLPEAITHFEAEASVSPDTITVERMHAKFETSDASFSGKLANPFPYLLPLDDIDRSRLKRPIFFFNLSSTRFDTDKLFPEAVPGSGEGTATSPPDSVSMVILPDIDGTGTVHVDTLIYMEVEFTNIDGKVKLAGKKIDCYDVTGNVYSGNVKGSTTIDLTDFENPVYTGEFEGTKIEIDDFASRFTPFSGHVFGKGEMAGNYHAEGWDPDAFLNSLTMTGKGYMRDGKLVTSGAVYSLLSNLAERTGNSFEQEQAIRNLNTNIEVRDGKVGLDNLKTRVGSIGDLTIGGFYGFDGSLEYLGAIELSEAVTKDLKSKGGLLGGLVDVLSNKDSDRLVLPLKIGGSLTAPSANIDYSALTEQATKDAANKATDLLKGLFNKDDD